MVPVPAFFDVDRIRERDGCGGCYRVADPGPGSLQFVRRYGKGDATTSEKEKLAGTSRL
ncbi:hypothetical protein OH76DRAFT_1396255 [Lentinus brumalis]|uniref:Uncharacterized protein n=1 Tax=Lentinus brumalis TaxID=2498619 RepID=A0A371DTR5_9APHY|nr:hypothetical protein OH76DRAFT_1396255 [Polyporus brumalis]